MVDGYCIMMEEVGKARGDKDGRNRAGSQSLFRYHFAG